MGIHYHNLKITDVSDFKIEFKTAGVYFEAKVTLTDGKGYCFNRIEACLVRDKGKIVANMENWGEFPSENQTSYTDFFSEEILNPQDLKSFLMNEDLVFGEEEQASNFIPMLFQRLDKPIQDYILQKMLVAL